MWGYYANPGNPDQPYEPYPGQSVFKLQLMGQPVPNAPIEIPEKLQNVVSIHEKLSYPDYYTLLSNAVRLSLSLRIHCTGKTFRRAGQHFWPDYNSSHEGMRALQAAASPRSSHFPYLTLTDIQDLLLPAFYQPGYYWDTASSSIAAGVIGRVPILGSPRLWKAYDYLAGPAMVKRDIATSEIKAVREMRIANDYVIPADVNAQWEKIFERIADRNMICWSKVMR